METSALTLEIARSDMITAYTDGMQLLQPGIGRLRGLVDPTHIQPTSFDLGDR